jgi:phage terminase large subunit GpA-like protein
MVKTQRLTAFIDVQERALFWCVIGWQEGFSGNVLDYGAHPQPPQSYFTYRQMAPTMDSLYPGLGVEARITAGLTDLLRDLSARQFQVDGGGSLPIERIGVDIGAHGEVIESCLASLPCRARVTPTRGYGITPASLPMADWAKRPGERRHAHWVEQAVGAGKPLRRLITDANHWKTFVHARLRTPMGGPGCLSLFGQSAETHRCLADHLTSEVPIETQGRGRKVQVWRLIAHRDNHWFDCAVGATAIASLLGATLAGETAAEAATQRRRAASDSSQRRHEYEQRRQGQDRR